MELINTCYSTFIERLYAPFFDRWHSPSVSRWYSRLVTILPVDSAFWKSDYGKFYLVIGIPVLLIVLNWIVTRDGTSSSRHAASPSYTASPRTTHTDTKPTYGTTPSKPAPPRPATSPVLTAAAPSTSNNGFFSSFDPASYRAYLSGLSNAALLRKEKSKMVAEVSGQAGVTGSAMSAIMSGGITAPFVLISARQLYLAGSKLPLIREEMVRRGLKPQKLTNGMIVKGVAGPALKSMVGVASN